MFALVAPSRVGLCRYVGNKFGSLLTILFGGVGQNQRSRTGVSAAEPAVFAPVRRPVPTPIGRTKIQAIIIAKRTPTQDTHTRRALVRVRVVSWVIF